MLTELIRNKLEDAEKGRKLWLELKTELKFTDDTYVILFPQSGTKCNTYTIKYLPEFIGRKNAGQVVLLSYDSEVLRTDGNIAANCSGVNVISRFFDRKSAECLMAYYMLQMFTDRLIIASLDEPEGRHGNNIVGINSITQEEIVKVGILGLPA